MCDKNADEIPCLQRPYQVSQAPGGEGQDDVNAGLKGRPVLYTGVIWIGIVRRFLIPRTCPSSIGYMEGRTPCPSSEVAPAPPRVVAHVPDVNPAMHEPPLKYKKPVVTEQVEDDEDARVLLRRKDDASPSPLRTLVVQVHEISAAAAAQARLLTEDLGAILRDGQDTTTEVLETVRSENGQKFRMAAISASGMVGYLAGLKRGVVTRMVYSATGATAMATICYPDETKVYNRQGLATVRRWMVLGLSRVHIGPQKPLGSGDMTIAYNTNVEDEEDLDEESENRLMNSQSIIAGLMHNLGSIGHHIQDIKAKLIESSQKTETNESAEENNPDDTQETLVEDLPPLQSDRFVNLSSNNNEDLTKDIPYSPDLTVPPQITSSQNKLNIPLYKREENTETKYLEEHIMRKKKSREFPRVLQEEVEVKSEDEADSDDEQQEENLYDFSDKTFVIPTGGLEEKLGESRKVMKNTSGSKLDDRPLNQKLTVYYRHMPEEERTSREKGYNDAYSNRGK